METSEQTEMAGTIESSQIDSPEDEAVMKNEDDGVCMEGNDMATAENKTTFETEEKLPACNIEFDTLAICGSEFCSEVPCQKEALVLEAGRDELNRNESITSSVSDTLSSADSVYENDLMPKNLEQEQLEKPKLILKNDEVVKDLAEPAHQEDMLEGLRCDESEEILKQQIKEGTLSDISTHSNWEVDPNKLDPDEPEPDPDKLDTDEQDNQFIPVLFPDKLDLDELDPEELDPHEQKPDKLDADKLDLQKPDPEEFDQDEVDPQSEEFDTYEVNLHEPDLEELDPDEVDLHKPDLEELDPDKVDLHEPDPEELYPDKVDLHEPDPEELYPDDMDLHEPDPEELDPDELYPDEPDECLRVEIASASSDSDNGEKWRAIFSSSINKEDDDSYLDSLELSAQDLFVKKIESKDIDHMETKEVSQDEEIAQEVEVLVQPCLDDYENLLQEETCDTSSTVPIPSLICKDQDERSQELKQSQPLCSHSVAAEPCKKIPVDYCVIQETKSENVSTEHVDFRLARKQWLEMEEQTKNQRHQPATKLGTCQGSHSVMYTPVRNIERPKRDSDPDRSEYSLTQFSPCSEDSGLDDSSYRSPYDEQETTIEKQIRLALEKEEILREESGISKAEHGQPQTRPIVLLCQEIDEKGMFEGQENGSRQPRSPSSNNPSFIITSSPAKGPLKHEMVANNIIILEPDSSPRHVAKEEGCSQPHSWASDENPNVLILETSNLIIRSASEFCLNAAGEEAQQSTFLNNPFFKLRSRSSLSLVDKEIKMVKQREEELKRQRANIYTKDKYNTIVVSPGLMDSLSFDSSVDPPAKCKSSPSSPMKTAYKMDRSTLSCCSDFPETYTGGRRKSAMALRWEAGEFANND